MPTAHSIAASVLEAAFDSGNENQLVEELRKVGSQRSRRDARIALVVQILEQTGSPRVRNAAALALADMRARGATDKLINVLRRNDTKGYRGTLLYALEQLDATLPLNLLADIIMEDSYESREEALNFIVNGKFDYHKNLRKVMHKLKAAFTSADEERYHTINAVLGYLANELEEKRQKSREEGIRALSPVAATNDPKPSTSEYRKPYALVLMPFAEKYNDTFTAIHNAAEAAGILAERVKDRPYFREGMIERIWNQIEGADFIISDLTVQNANVYYETGYALANGKLIILLTKNPKKIPFDQKNRKHVIYSSLKDLEHQLQRELVAAKDKTDLSFDLNDSQCVVSVVENKIEQRVVDKMQAISIRVKFQVNSEMSPRNVVPRLSKIEKLISKDSWEEAKLVAPILLTWVDNDTNETDFDQKKTQYVNVIHTNERENQLAIWGVNLLPSVAQFLQEHTKYRLTISVLEKQLKIEVDWRGRWDTVQPIPVTGS